MLSKVQAPLRFAGILMTLRGLMFASIAVCLSLAFAVSVVEFQAMDRSHRQQHRSRANRGPRYRISPGVSMDCCVIQASAARRFIASGTPAEPVLTTNSVVFNTVALVVPAPQQQPRPVHAVFAALPRPPPHNS